MNSLFLARLCSLQSFNWGQIHCILKLYSDDLAHFATCDQSFWLENLYLYNSIGTIHFFSSIVDYLLIPCTGLFIQLPTISDAHKCVTNNKL